MKWRRGEGVASVANTRLTGANFGSVAMIGVTGEFSEVWQIQGLATFWREAGVGGGGVRSAARRGRMGLAGQAIDRAVSESLEPSILDFYYLSSDK